MKKRPRTKFRSNFNLLSSIQEKYNIPKVKVPEIQQIIFSGGKTNEILKI
jgi:hypothetical protein